MVVYMAAEVVLVENSVVSLFLPDDRLAIQSKA